MSQLSKTIVHWLSPALLLVFMSACGQETLTQNGSNSASNQSPEPTAVAPPGKSEPASSNPKPSTNPLRNSGSAGAGNQSDSSTSARSPSSAVNRSESARATVSNNLGGLNPTIRAEERLAGFSTDGNHYVYLESSRDTGAGIPKSTLQLIDVASNACADQGCLETRYKEGDTAVKTTDAENDLLKQTWKIRQDLKLTPPVAGNKLPILSRSRLADGTETITVRVGDRSQPLQLRLTQKQIPAARSNGAVTQDQAAMQLTVTYNGQERSLDSLSHFRAGVLGYSIRAVELSPDGNRVAVLITATKPTFEGTLGTTVVQGFSL